MRTRETITVSLPPAMFREVQRVSKSEARTHSELVREALRTYFYSRVPLAAASRRELAAIRRGRAEIKAGKYVMLDELFRELDTADRGAGAQKS